MIIIAFPRDHALIMIIDLREFNRAMLFTSPV